jgi:hypothetical protein
MRVNNPSIVLAALLAGFATGGFAPPPADDGAQISPARVDAIIKCIKVAQTRHPDDGVAEHQGRYLAYEQCMTDAGQKP